MYDEKTKTINRSKLVVTDYTHGDFRFKPDTDIATVINQVIFQSKYPGDALKPDKLDAEGYRKWWKIDPRVYPKDEDGNYTKTGVKSKYLVYRVIPYGVHSSAGMSTNEKPPGLDKIKEQVVKEYHYIYTGKNVDILNFDIKFNGSFYNALDAASFKAVDGSKTVGNRSNIYEAKPHIEPVKPGAEPSKEQDKNAGVDSKLAVQTGMNLDNQGGSGLEDAKTRAYKAFHNIITNDMSAMAILELHIMGDPYWIMQNGVGKYSSKPKSKFMCEDGTVNWQDQQVMIMVKFKTPIDINNITGMYDLPNSSGSGAVAEVASFTGYYAVTTITSTFKGGKFEQVLNCYRINNQEKDGEGNKDKIFNPENTKGEPVTPQGWNG